MSGVYDFSQLFRSSIVAFSPGTTFIATAHLNRIIVRSTANLAVVRTWLCQPSSPAAAAAASSSKRSPSEDGFPIDSIQWSDDGMYILGFSAKTSSAWVFGLVEEGIGACGELALLAGEGLDGLVHVEWAQGGREVLAWSDHNLRVTIYSLKDSSARVIQNPKSHVGCHCYSADGRYMAMLERRSGKDHVGVYDAQNDFKLVRNFALQTSDSQGISLSPDGKWLAVWDSALSYSLFVHSPMGPALLHLHPQSPGFLPAAQDDARAEDPGMGIRTVQWTPGGRFMAVGDWSGKVRVVEVEGWRCIAEMGWGSRVTDKRTSVWKEPHEWLSETRGRGIVQFDRASGSGSIPTLRPDFSATPPISGVSQLAFSASGSHLLVQLEIQPNVLHVHSFLPSPTAASPVIQHVAAVVFSHPVRAAKWAPQGTKLAAVCRAMKSGSSSSASRGAVYFWDAEGWVEEGAEEGEGMMEGVGIPLRADFAPTDMVFSPDGTALALLDKQQFCLLYEADDEGLSRRPADLLLDDEGLSGIVEEDEEDDQVAGPRGYGRLDRPEQLKSAAGLAR